MRERVLFIFLLLIGVGCSGRVETPSSARNEPIAETAAEAVAEIEPEALVETVAAPEAPPAECVVRVAARVASNRARPLVARAGDAALVLHRPARRAVWAESGCAGNDQVVLVDTSGMTSELFADATHEGCPLRAFHVDLVASEVGLAAVGCGSTEAGSVECRLAGPGLVEDVAREVRFEGACAPEPVELDLDAQLGENGVRIAVATPGCGVLVAHVSAGEVRTRVAVTDARDAHVRLDGSALVWGSRRAELGADLALGEARPETPTRRWRASVRDGSVVLGDGTATLALDLSASRAVLDAIAMRELLTWLDGERLLAAPVRRRADRAELIGAPLQIAESRAIAAIDVDIAPIGEGAVIGWTQGRDVHVALLECGARTPEAASAPVVAAGAAGTPLPDFAHLVQAPPLDTLATSYERFCGITRERRVFCGVGTSGAVWPDVNGALEVGFAGDQAVVRTTTEVLVAPLDESGVLGASRALAQLAGAIAIATSTGEVCAVLADHSVRCNPLGYHVPHEAPFTDAIDVGLLPDGSRTVLCVLRQDGRTYCGGCAHDWSELGVYDVDDRFDESGYQCTRPVRTDTPRAARLDPVGHYALAAVDRRGEVVAMLPALAATPACTGRCACADRSFQAWRCVEVDDAGDAHVLRPVRVLGDTHALLADGRLVQVSERR